VFFIVLIFQNIYNDCISAALQQKTWFQFSQCELSGGFL